MLTIQLDVDVERRLRELAAAQGEELSGLARRVLEDYLDLQGWKPDSAEAWSEAAVALAPEIMQGETWPEKEDADGSR